MAGEIHFISLAFLPLENYGNRREFALILTLIFYSLLTIERQAVGWLNKNPVCNETNN